ncbi:MAG TPA: triose-phosphate isomerase [Thermoanaerobaculia bacterium]|nr:triose-phosphate isomerase [Thermoanaerobaculia bacterium]
MTGVAPGRRRPLVAANWKMHHLRSDAEAFCRELMAAGSPLAAAGGAAAEVVVFPSFPLLPAVAAGHAGGTALGAQDLHPADAGAHTGDVSGAQLADAGCTWALAGHSERRHDHGEDDALVAAKIGAALRHGLRPMVCVGETRDERRAGRTLDVLDRQLAAALDALPAPGEAAAGTGWALAYEPVWAIGTGETATPTTAQEAHAHLRRRLAERLGAPGAAAVRLLYGGSVKPANAGELIAQPDVDGFLVGGASLDAASFLAIIAACA